MACQIGTSQGILLFLWFYLGIPQPEGVQGIMRECLPKRDTRALGIGTTSSESRAADIRISSGAESQYGVVKHGLQAGIRCFVCGCIDYSLRHFLVASMGGLTL